MKASTKYEQQIIREIKGMPPGLQKKIAHMINEIKQESLKSGEDEKRATERFLAVCGSWRDSRTVAEQVNDIYRHRKSRSKMTDLS